MNWLVFHRYRWLACLSAAGFAAGIVPVSRAQDTQWFRLNGMPQVSVGLDTEGSTEKTSVRGSSTTYDQISITPLVELQTSGSIYHPNLLAFDLSGDLGWGWDSMSSSGFGSNQTRNESEELRRYLAEFNLLSAKPYNASFYSAQDHSYRDYGQFNTYTVDTTRYGGRINWTDAAFTLSTDLGYRNEVASGLTDSSEITETYLNFLGIHQRKFGQTTLTLHLNEMENAVGNGARFDSQSWSAGISDSETFGHRRQFSANTGLSYSQSEYSGQQIDTLTANENLIVHHRPNLESYLMFNFNQSELGQINSSRLQSSVGVRHQLYESLTSNLEAHNIHQENTAASGNSTYDQYGLGLNENYSKRLQSWGRLGFGTGIGVDHQEQYSPAGTQTWFEEPHQIYQLSSPSYQKGFLVHPRVSNVMEVKSGSYTLPTSDYLVVQSGELTEIQLVPSPSFPTASLMVNGALAVTITYQSQSLGSSAYDTFSYSAQLRLDLWNQIGIYGRLNWMDNNAPPEVLTQSLTDLVGGVDYKHKWFHTGAEYESYDSNFTQYEALRFFQDFDFLYSQSTTLGFNLTETFYHYPANGDQSQYQCMSHYNTRLPLSLIWSLELGALMQKISSTEQVQGVARTSLGWSRGKLSLRAGYEFNGQSTESSGFTEERIKHRFFTYLRRSF